MGFLGIDLDLENEILNYCIRKDLNFQELADMKKIWGVDMLKFEKDNVIVLKVSGYGENIMIEPTEYTKQYLSK